LFNNRDESTIERKFWIWMSTAKSAEMHTHCFAAWEFEAISVATNNFLMLSNRPSVKHLTPPSGKFSRMTTIFPSRYICTIKPYKATKIWKQNSEIAYRSRDTNAKPYIRNPFFELWEFPIRTFLYVLRRKVRQGTDFFFNSKNLQTHLLNVWRHLAKIFQREPQILCSHYVGLVKLYMYKILKTEFQNYIPFSKYWPKTGFQ